MLTLKIFELLVPRLWCNGHQRRWRKRDVDNRNLAKFPKHVSAWAQSQSFGCGTERPFPVSATMNSTKRRRSVVLGFQ